MQFWQMSWLQKGLSVDLQNYFNALHKLTVVRGLLLHDCRIGVPASLEDQALQKILEGRLDIQKCLLRVCARRAVWFAGLTSNIKNMVL